MRIMVTGAQGMLGRELAARLEREHDVVAVDVGDFDITDCAAVEAGLRQAQPDLVCHCAGYTDVDGCERDPARAFRVNALGAWNVAAACSQVGAGMIYISTDFVFDGEKGAPYTEYDEPRPLGVYGASKLAGERHVRELVVRHFIVRTAWLFAPHGRNFVLSILGKAREHAVSAAATGERPTLRVVADQVGSPTSAADLADAITRHLVGSRLYGTYHITNAGGSSWAELAAEALRLAGSPARVEPISASEWPTPTRRPAYSVLRHLSLELQGRDDLRPWPEALAEVVATLGATAEGGCAT
ncbi:MAG TPA: dTDP-4-dehydrorhamnose reductase [Armatimonadota bacterium]|nr:dTDP-4-dehydrorhamnose reductase [Armatimonadota bacterium]